ncbi:putative protein kinase RLK-Pelle-LRR-XII-1 family [Rosa chinensis]|uniref:Protein kinase domain-containing protein n=1 Tax=Rosa chinensis TaxID=74649 RepID=A0A2P6SHG9_ROSCH|nr:putative protein kinase RLK-Pelle-LRR-XII-1 family [Rosa chinensis]
MLSVNLPSSLGGCESLEVLHLQGNFFEGLIPSSMKRLRGLRDLDLSRNNLSRDISQFFKGFKNLENLNHSFNEFWGEVSVEGIFRNASMTSIVGNTRLCSGIANFQLPVCSNGGLSCAFGSVYKGSLDDDRVVAVKIFNMLHKGSSKSFIAKCEALRNIRHRNLIKVLTACSSIDFHGNDFKALVYELMENGSLEEWLHPSIGNEVVLEAPKILSLVQRHLAALIYSFI